MAKEKSVKDKKTAPAPRKVNLALQGGGSHGAFTWGVLDAILEDGRLKPEAISATSAGSMNAVMMLSGLQEGGVEGARKKLETFWHRVSGAANAFSPIQEEAVRQLSSANPFFGNLMKWSINPSATASFFTAWSNTLSPYQFNPLNINPLRDIVEDMVDFKKLKSCDEAKLFITATHVESGQPRVFNLEEVSLDVVMASATLPSVFQAVKIKGEHYWDGGYMGNPALWPLFYKAESKDILIVHVNPMTRNEVPKDSATIENRLNEITFNSSMMHEFRAISFVQKLLNENMLKEEFRPLYKDIRLHAVRAEAAMKGLDVASKFDTSWSFLQQMKKLGVTYGKKWLTQHGDDVGVRASVDIQRDYLGKS